MSDEKNGTGNDLSTGTDKSYTDISNLDGGITDEELADEFLAYPVGPHSEVARYQFNFLGAELEKINNAKNIRDELKK